MTEADTAAPLTDDQGGPAFSDKTVQVEGSYGTGGVLAMEGSNDGANWGTLNDVLGSALTTVALDAVHAIAENPREIRPSITAGTGVSVDVRIVGRAIIQKT